ncbi:MAG: hypothetical protein ACOX3A_04345 [bacterium]
MKENKIEILLEEIYRLVEIVAEGVGENRRRIEHLTVEINKIKENQARMEIILRRLEGKEKTSLPLQSVFFSANS